jgi:hypothetical protein
MGASFMYASANSLDMSWLPLSRFESRSVRVAVSRRVRGAGVQHPISVGKRRGGIAGPAVIPVQVFRTGRAVYWEFLRLWTGFELPSSWLTLPAYGSNLNRNILDIMRWHQIDLGAQDLNEIQRLKSFQVQVFSRSKFLDEYYNSYLRK